jgi:hypothetical protein
VWSSFEAESGYGNIEVRGGIMDFRRLRTMKSAVLALSATAACVLAAGNPARGDFNFNPSGGAFTPTFTVQGLGFGPGNVLSQGSIPITPGATTQLFFQTHLTSLTGNTAPSNVPGLNSSYYITEVGSISETVGTVTTAANGVQTVSFVLNPSPNNRISIYYTPGAWSNTNDATGTGFVTGSSVEIARLTPTSFISSTYNDTTSVNGLQPFNQTNPPSGNDPNARANAGSGSTTINNSVPIYNTAFFQPPSGTPTLTSSIFKANLSPSFDAIPPSLQFLNPVTSAVIIPNIGPSAGGGVGAINGQTGTDFQLQVSGFTQSFTVVPEPASVTLIGIGVVGVGALSFRKRNRPA